MEGLTGQALAVALAQAGHVVVPVPPRGKLPHPKYLRRDADGKPSVAATIAHPLTAAEVAAVRTKDGKSWHSWGLYVTGRLVVVDADDPYGLREFFGQELPPCPTVKSGSGRGLHFWLQAPDGIAFSKARYPLNVDDHHLGEVKMPTGGDKASLVVLPGALHRSGGRYDWVPGRAWGDIPIPAAPGWLVQTAQTAHGPSRQFPEARRKPPTHIGNAPLATREDSGEKAQPKREDGDTTYVGSNRLRRSDSLPSSLPELAPADTEAFAQRLVELSGEQWPGLGRAFKCVVREDHADDEMGSRSATVFRGDDGRLRYRCFRSHKASSAWSLTHLYVYLKTGDPSVLGAFHEEHGRRQSGLGSGAWKLWTARALIEFGMVASPELDAGMWEPETVVSDGALRVWRGFVRALNAQAVYDLSNIYVAVFGKKFAAAWCGVPLSTAFDGIRELTQIEWLRPVGKTQRAGANAYAVGDDAFRWGKGPGTKWYPSGQGEPIKPDRDLRPLGPFHQRPKGHG
jgi:hypothetical protein